MLDVDEVGRPNRAVNTVAVAGSTAPGHARDAGGDERVDITPG